LGGGEVTEQTKHDRIFLHNHGTWWSHHVFDKDDVEYIRADIATGYWKTVDDLRTIAVDACNKAFVEIDDLKQQLAAKQAQIDELKSKLEKVIPIFKPFALSSFSSLNTIMFHHNLFCFFHS
jgi:hypothetical protein